MTPQVVDPITHGICQIMAMSGKIDRMVERGELDLELSPVKFLTDPTLGMGSVKTYAFTRVEKKMMFR